MRWRCKMNIPSKKFGIRPQMHWWVPQLELQMLICFTGAHWGSYNAKFEQVTADVAMPCQYLHYFINGRVGFQMDGEMCGRQRFPSTQTSFQLFPLNVPARVEEVFSFLFRS